MKITGGSPNLINGVSRQPPEVRLVSQLEESINQFPTVTRGLAPRNPALLSGVIEGNLPSEGVMHLIDRDEAEKYFITISAAGITVHDMAGNPKTVNAPGGWGYLNGARSDDLEALTVADHTFILNRQKVVKKMADVTPVPVPRGLVHVVQGEFNSSYKVFCDGMAVAVYTTAGGPYDNTADARAAEAGARTQKIAQRLADGWVGQGFPAGSTPAASNGVVTNYINGYKPAGLGSAIPFSAIVLDNVIAIERGDGGDFRLEAEAGSETRIRAHKGTSAKFSELPRRAPGGFTLKIRGDEATNYDDFWVRFVRDNASAQGSWLETVAPGIQYKFDASTMPHILVREADGTFTFKPAPWEPRKVGDEDTNPWPTFTDQKISGMAFGNNRLGFTTGESLVQSRHGSFFDFWVESILTPLDTDPIDAAISYPEVSTISHVVPFSGETILFTASVPFRMAGGDTLTQKNIRYEHVSGNKVSPKARPVAAGSRLYFVNDTESGTFVHEFAHDRNTDALAATSISEHIPGYVPAGITQLSVSEDLRTLVLRGGADRRELYVYKWLFVDGNKVQSAWQKWVLPHEVLHTAFMGDSLVLVTDVPAADGSAGHREILSIPCHEAWPGDGTGAIYLDRLMTLTGVYDAATDATSYSPPIWSPSLMAVCGDADSHGVIPKVRSSVPGALVLEGDWTRSIVRFGVPLPSSCVLSPFLHRSRSSNGTYGNAVPGFTTTISALRLGTGPTAYLNVELERLYRKPFVYALSSGLLGSSQGVTGRAPSGRIAKTLSVLSKSEDVTITLRGVGPFGYSLNSLEWSGDAKPVGY